MSKWIQWKGLYHREVARYFKVPLQTIGAPIVSTILYLLIFGLSLGKSIHIGEDLPYLAFLIPGLIAMSLLKNAFDNSTSAIMGQKYANELQDLRVVPLTPHQIATSKTVASLSRGILVAFITYLIGQLFYFFSMGDFLPISAPITFTYFLLIGGFAFGSLGIAIGMLSRSFEHVGAVSMLILLPLIYLGGVFFSLENLHPFWQTLSHFNPLFYIINGIRYGMLQETDTSLSAAIIFTFAFSLFSYFLSYLSLRKGSRYLR